MDGCTPTPTHGGEKDGGAFRKLLRAMMGACCFFILEVLRNVFSE